MVWTLVFRGGPWDKRQEEVNLSKTPDPIIIIWYCGSGPEWDCHGHASFVGDPNIILGLSTAYRRSALDEEEAKAVYDVGEGYGNEDDRDAAEERNILDLVNA